MTLESAASALARGDQVVALDALLVAWRDCRAPELAELIDVVSKDVTRGLDPIEAGAPGYDAEWSEVAQLDRSIDVERLLPGLWSAPKGAIPLRLRTLLARNPDPRIGRGLLRMVSQPPTTASSNFSTWTRLFKALPSYVDSSAIPVLEERAAVHDGASKFWPKLSAWIEAAIPELPESAALPPEQLELVAEMRERARELAAGPPPVIQQTAVEDEQEVVTSLETALDHLTEGRAEQSLQALCAFWGRCRSPEVADLIDRLGAIVDLRSAPVEGKAAALHRAWMERAAKPSAADVGQLLDALRSGKLSDVEERLSAMIRWDPDPRVSRAMVATTRDYMIGARPLLWRCLYDLLVHNADVRTRDAVLKRGAGLDEAWGDRRRMERSHFRRTREAFVAACDLPHVLAPEERESLEALASGIETSQQRTRTTAASPRRW